MVKKEIPPQQVLSTKGFKACSTVNFPSDFRDFQTCNVVGSYTP